MAVDLGHLFRFGRSLLQVCAVEDKGRSVSEAKDIALDMEQLAVSDIWKYGGNRLVEELAMQHRADEIRVSLMEVDAVVLESLLGISRQLLPMVYVVEACEKE